MQVDATNYLKTGVAKRWRKRSSRGSFSGEILAIFGENFGILFFHSANSTNFFCQISPNFRYEKIELKKRKHWGGGAEPWQKLGQLDNLPAVASLAASSCHRCCLFACPPVPPPPVLHPSSPSPPSLPPSLGIIHDFFRFLCHRSAVTCHLYINLILIM